MKKYNLALIIVLLYSLISVSSISAETAYEKTATYEKSAFISEVFKNVPEENWTSESQTTVSQAKFIPNNISINNDRVTIDGTLEYDDNKISINQEGVLKKGQINPSSDYVIEFESGKNINSTSMKLIHGMLIKSATSAQLDQSKDLLGKEVLKLVFFDPKTRDLIIFEEDMNNVSVHYLDQYSLNNNSLEETESEFWHHKVVKPSFEYFSLSEDSDSIPEGIQTYIKYLESQGEEIFPKNIGIQSRTYSRDVTMFGKLTYQTHLGTTTHYMRLYAYANMYYPQGTTNLNTGIRVENISMQLPDGSWLNGQSNLEAGRASHLSVATLVSTYPNQSNEASYISTLHWDGGYFYRSGSDLSFSISLQRGPLTATANYTTQNLTRNYSKLVNIYEAGPNYPREAKSEFDRTFLREIDQGYTINYSIVTHAPLDTQRALRVRFYVPFYDKLQIGKSGHVDNATEDLYIYYK